MIVKSLMFDIPSLDGRLHAAVAPKPLAVPTGPVNGILVSIIDPIFVVVVNQHHAASSV